MRVMVIIKANEQSEAGVMPSEKLLTDMGNFNEELVKAGVMLAGEGLHPSSKGKRVKFSGGQRIVTDGPFAETKELIAGFWIWKVNSMDEAIEWVKRMPSDPNDPSSGEIPQRASKKPSNLRLCSHSAQFCVLGFGFWVLSSRSEPKTQNPRLKTASTVRRP